MTYPVTIVSVKITEPGSMTDVYNVIMVKCVCTVCCVFSGDSVMVENGLFSWSEDDPPVLREFVFRDFLIVI